MTSPISTMLTSSGAGHGSPHPEHAGAHKDEKHQKDGPGLHLLREKQLGTLFVDRVTVLSVSKLDTIGSAFAVTTLTCSVVCAGLTPGPDPRQ